MSQRKSTLYIHIRLLKSPMSIHYSVLHKPVQNQRRAIISTPRVHDSVGFYHVLPNIHYNLRTASRLQLSTEFLFLKQKHQDYLISLQATKLGACICLSACLSKHYRPSCNKNLLRYTNTNKKKKKRGGEREREREILEK